MVVPVDTATWTASLPFAMQTQLQTEWCWAATSSSVSHFYESSSVFSQCSIVNSELTLTTCCTDGSTPQCNAPWYLNRALTCTGNLASVENAAPLFTQLVSEISAGRVVCARIAWNGGGGHFLALDAVDVPNARVQVCDPINGVSDYAYTDFVNAYRGMGTCTTGYLTRAAVSDRDEGGGSAPTAISSGVREPLSWAAARLTRAARQRQDSASGVSTDQPTFRVFFIGLNDAASGDSLTKAQFIGYQSIVEDPTTQMTASVEINVDAKNALGSPHITRGPFARSMSAQTIEIGDLRGFNGFKEYRYLKIPALQLCALWVILAAHDDVLIPLEPAPSPLQPGRRYDVREFESLIVPLAMKRREFNDL